MGGGVQPVVGRVIKHADSRLAALDVTDRYTVMRDATRVISGAVDRVDNPHTLAAVTAFFLADKRVVGIARRNRCADEALDFAVHRGDNVVASLERCDRLTERGMGELARVTCELGSEIKSIHHSSIHPSQLVDIPTSVPKPGAPGIGHNLPQRMRGHTRAGCISRQPPKSGARGCAWRRLRRSR